jgi:hypothetical protein
LDTVHDDERFETDLSQFSRFLNGFCRANDEAVIRQIAEEGFVKLDVDEGVVDFPVAKELLDVYDVFGVVVLHRCPPMAEGVEVDFEEPGVLQFEGQAFTGPGEGCFQRV